jgi:hypothetical protein
MPIVPLFGLGMKGKSPTITAQRRINMYAERYGYDADKSQLNFLWRPGLTRLANGLGNAPVRGISEQIANYGGVAGNDTIFLAMTDLSNPGLPGLGFGFYSPGGTTAMNYPASQTLLTTLAGTVNMAYNGAQVLAVDGQRGVCIGTGAISTVTPLPGATSFPLGATSVCFIAGKFVVNDPSFPGRFRWSGTYDGTVWNALDFATAESSADPLAVCVESLGELVNLGRDTIEFWGPTGGTDVFRRIGGSGIDWGCTAKNSVAKINGGMCFLGRSRAGGERQVLFVQGHTAQPISTPDVTFDINQSLTPDAATGCAYVIGAHSFYQLNLPETTWVYDFNTNVWSEYTSAGGRFAVDRAQAAFGLILATDYRDSRIYKLDTSTFLDDQDLITAQLDTKHVLADYDRLTARELFVEFQGGDATVPATYPGSLVYGGASGTFLPGWAAALGSLPGNVSWCVEMKIRLPSSIYGSFGTLPLWSKTVLLGNSGPAVSLNLTALSVSNQIGGGIAIGPVSPYIIQPDSWLMVSVSYDNPTGNFGVFINGNALYTESVVRNWGGDTAGTIFNIGRASVLTPSIAGGGVQFSEVRIWNGSRTAAQILANVGVNFQGNEVGLQAFWGIPPSSPAFDGTGLGQALSFSGTNYIAIGTRDDVPYTPARDGQVMLSWSKDGGRTFGSEAWTTLGAQGKYQNRAVWRLLGLARDMVFRLKVTDPVRRVITNAAMTIT